MGQKMPVAIVAAIIGAAAVILAPVISSLFQQPTHSTEAKNFQNSVVSQNQTGGITAGQVTNNYIFQLIQSNEKNNYEVFAKKYPLGYKVFAVYDGKIIRHGEEQFIKNYVVDWDSAKVLTVTKDAIRLVLPSIKHISTNNISYANEQIISRVVGIPIRGGGVDISPDFDTYLEVVENNSDVVILVIGLRPKNKV